MPRKTKEVAGLFGRDLDKKYVIGELSAREAEAWGGRMMEAITKSGYPIFDALNFTGGNMAALATVGLGVVVSAQWSLAGPLHAEIIDRCVARLLPDNKTRGAKIDGRVDPIGRLLDEDIEEIQTLLLLRSEVFELHTGFSFAATLSPKWEEFKAAFLRSNSTATQTSDP